MAKTRMHRVVLHCHSQWSYDGHWRLDQIARLFGTLGADAVLMTEHDQGFSEERFAAYRAACAEASTPRCTLVPGIEYSSPDNAVHILTWGLAHYLAEYRPVTETLERVAEGGGVAVFAHPARRDAWQLFDPAWVPLLAGIEIWNRKTDGVAPGTEALQLQAETGLAPTVGIDFHRWRHYWPLGHLAPGTGDVAEDAVAAVRAGTLQPYAFRRALSGSGGAPQHWLERRRRGLRDLIRGKRHG